MTDHDSLARAAERAAERLAHHYPTVSVTKGDDRYVVSCHAGSPDEDDASSIVVQLQLVEQDLLEMDDADAQLLVHMLASYVVANEGDPAMTIGDLAHDLVSSLDDATAADVKALLMVGVAP